MMSRAIKAIYENGILKPSEKLPLDDQAEVLVIVVPLRRKARAAESDPTRLAQMRKQVDAWLKAQPPDAVRPPLSLSPAQEQALEGDFEAALAAIRARASQFSELEIAADVDAALDEVRTLSPEDRARLEAEIDAIFAEIAADAVV